MNSTTIAELLESRGAWLKGASHDHDSARSRFGLTRKISENYPLFEQVRDRIFHATESFIKHVEIIPETLTPDGHSLLAEMFIAGLVVKEDHGHEICEVQGRRYLSGGWLEELAWLAAQEAGAHECVYGQAIGWSVKGFTGENEIDLIVRRSKTLGFVSCKALRSELDIQDRKHRNRLMDAVHEADNLADHFGRNGERVAVLVTTDLYDELRGVPRYNALMGKAAVLDVRIIPLEELQWDRLVQAIAGLWDERPS
jgi:hypothetical protein